MLLHLISGGISIVNKPEYPVHPEVQCTQHILGDSIIILNRSHKVLKLEERKLYCVKHRFAKVLGLKPVLLIVILAKFRSRVLYLEGGVIYEIL